jgi:hypothetical protein
VRLPRVGILHAPFAAATYGDILRSAAGVCDVVFLFRPTVARANARFVELARELAEAVVLEDDARPVPGLRLDGLTTFHDGELDYADRLAVLLGLQEPMESPLVWDKLEQRRALAAHGVSRVRAAPVDSRESFRDAVARIGLPGVLKPRRSTASVGLSVVQDEHAADRELAERGSWVHLVYEELIPAGRHPAGESWIADYVSVETCSTDAERLHVAIFDKAPPVVLDPDRAAGGPQVMEMADFAPTQLPREAQEAVLRLTDHALRALGVRWRVTHTELRVLDGRAEVIEVNGRLGGEVVRLLDILSGPDLVCAALCVALQAEPNLKGGPNGGYAGSVKPLLPNRRALVRSSVSRADVRRLPSIVGVNVVARRGARPSASDFRAVDVTFAAEDLPGLKASLAGILDGVAALYRADGVGDDPWLNRMRALAAA